jgi:hypothetical protein
VMMMKDDDDEDDDDDDVDTHSFAKKASGT